MLSIEQWRVKINQRYENFFVYILKCSDNSYYTGFTNDLERRLLEHQNGCNPKSYTFQRRPVKLVYYESFDNPTKAIDFEKKLKGWSRSKKEALINKNWKKLKNLSECQNQTTYKNFNK